MGETEGVYGIDDNTVYVTRLAGPEGRTRNRREAEIMTDGAVARLDYDATMALIALLQKVAHWQLGDAS